MKHDLTSLELFALVCDTGNITKAADQAHLVGSAISKRLVLLEEAFGMPLLVRKRYGVAPTPAGETLLEHSRAVLEALRRLERDMGTHTSGVRGHIRMVASASVFAERLADDVAAFLKIPEHKGIQLDIEERNSLGVARGVREGSATLGICWEAADLEGLTCHRYRTDHLAVVVPKKHPLSQRKQVLFEDTLDYEHVGMPPPNPVKVVMQRAAAISGKPLNYRVVVSTFEASLRVVAAGLAISVMPLEFAAGAIKGMPVKVLPLSNPWATRRFVICHRSGTTLSPAAQLLLNHLSSLEGDTSPSTTAP
jgi:DNA-binding transcriptional LysR family regulator